MSQPASLDPGGWLGTREGKRTDLLPPAESPQRDEWQLEARYGTVCMPWPPRQCVIDEQYDRLRDERETRGRG